MLTRQRLKELLLYDPNIGLFMHLRSQAAAKAGDIAGTKRQKYCKIYVDGRPYFAHRLVWLYEYGVWPTKHIDHINGNPMDNRICNLREATVSQNQVNSAAKKHSKTGHRGIHMHKCGRYRVQLQKDGKPVHAGYFDTIESAVIARDNVYRKIHGEFARL
jgi:hypothetical protein